VGGEWEGGVERRVGGQLGGWRGGNGLMDQLGWGVGRKNLHAHSAAQPAFHLGLHGSVLTLMFIRGVYQLQVTPKFRVWQNRAGFTSV
jgi:hypothetical protein